MEGKKEKEIRIGRLTSVGRVGVEIGRVYRAARHGKIRTDEGARLVQMLIGLKSCLESADFEQRMATLEKAVEKAIEPAPSHLKLVK
jgi:hypothetical protein